MKKILILIAIGSSFAANAQVDPAFTAKMVDHVNAASLWYQSGYDTTGIEYGAFVSSIEAFYPTYKTNFQSKLSAMLNSPTEMAKFSGPIQFVQCLGSATQQYNSCINSTSYYLPNGTVQFSPQCIDNYQNSIIQCGITHLTN